MQMETQTKKMHQSYFASETDEQHDKSNLFSTFHTTAPVGLNFRKLYVSTILTDYTLQFLVQFSIENRSFEKKITILNKIMTRTPANLISVALFRINFLNTPQGSQSHTPIFHFHLKKNC